MYKRQIKTSTTEILPEYSIVRVSILDSSKNLIKNGMGYMDVKEFLELSGEEINYTYGVNKNIGYEGYGYMGEHTYYINLSNFNVNRMLRPGVYTLITEIVYNDSIISSGERIISVI